MVAAAAAAPEPLESFRSDRWLVSAFGEVWLACRIDEQLWPVVCWGGARQGPDDHGGKGASASAGFGGSRQHDFLREARAQVRTIAKHVFCSDPSEGYT